MEYLLYIEENDIPEHFYTVDISNNGKTSSGRIGETRICGSTLKDLVSRVRERNYDFDQESDFVLTTTSPRVFRTHYTEPVSLGYLLEFRKLMIE